MDVEVKMETDSSQWYLVIGQDAVSTHLYAGNSVKMKKIHVVVLTEHWKRLPRHSDRIKSWLTLRNGPCCEQEGGTRCSDVPSSLSLL